MNAGEIDRVCAYRAQDEEFRCLAWTVSNVLLVGRNKGDIKMVRISDMVSRIIRFVVFLLNFISKGHYYQRISSNKPANQFPCAKLCRRRCPACNHRQQPGDHYLETQGGGHLGQASSTSTPRCQACKRQCAEGDIAIVVNVECTRSHNVINSRC